MLDTQLVKFSTRAEITWLKFSSPQCSVNTTRVSLWASAVLKVHIETGLCKDRNYFFPLTSILPSFAADLVPAKTGRWNSEILLRDFSLFFLSLNNFSFSNVRPKKQFWRKMDCKNMTQMFLTSMKNSLNSVRHVIWWALLLSSLCFQRWINNSVKHKHNHFWNLLNKGVFLLIVLWVSVYFSGNTLWLKYWILQDCHHIPRSVCENCSSPSGSKSPKFPDIHGPFFCSQ